MGSVRSLRGYRVSPNAPSSGNLLMYDGTEWLPTATVTGAKTFSGAVTLSSTLDVTGAATLSSTLAVTGASTLTGAVTMSGAATVGTTLGVTGAVTLSSTLAVSGLVTINTGSGSTMVIGFGSENLTLSTGGATTNTAANLLPANSIILGVSGRVTTSITTATDWALGDANVATRFTAANSTMTAGTTGVGLNHHKGAVSADNNGPTQTSAAAVRVTTTGTPGAGAIRIVVPYIQFTAPTS